MNLTKRQMSILLKFMENKVYITSNDLSTTFSLSVKTIRNEIKLLNSVIKDYGMIASVHSKGYYLTIKNEKEFKRLLKAQQNSKDKFIPNNPLERAHYILGMLLKERNYLKIDDISEKIYIDRTAISRSLKYIKTCIERFGLKIIQKNGLGVMIIGDEIKYRQCMAEYVFHKQEIMNTNIGDNNEFIKEFKQCIFDDGITMPERIFKNFIIHIQVQIDSIKAGFYVNFEKNELEFLKNEYEHIVARDIGKIIKKYFNLSMSEEEICYLTIHLLGKKSNSISEIESCINNQLKQEIDLVVQKIFNKVYMIYGIDFSEDYYLRKAIGIHLKPMENRLKYNTYLRNTMLYDIKEKYIYAYIISLEAWKVISNHLKCTNDEGEIASLALHFQYALERKRRNSPKKRILIVNDYGPAVSELISFSLLKEFTNSLTIENIICANELYGHNISNYDYIISTVEIEQDTSIPIIMINPIVTNKSMEGLKPYFEERIQYKLNNYLKKENIYCNLEIEDKQEFLEWLYKGQANSFHEFKELNGLTSERCEFELDNQIAFHYVNSEGDCCKLGVVTLKRPIIWTDRMIKVIFLLKISNNSDKSIQILDSLSKYMEDQHKVKMLLVASMISEVEISVMQ